MRKLLIAALLLLPFGAGGALAAPLLSIQVFDNGTLIGSTSNVAGGFASLSTSDNFFSSVAVSAAGVPLTANPGLATTTLDTRSNPGSADRLLSIQVTQTGLTGFPSGSLSNTFTGNTLLSGGNYSTFTIANYIDASNTAFGTGILLAAANYSNLGLGSFSTGPVVTSVTPGGLFSETTIYTILFTGGEATISGSAQLIGVAAVPEPMSLALFGAGLLGLGFVQRARKRA